MNNLSLARALMILGLLIFVVGGLIYLAARFGLPFGHLPGDIRIVRQNFTCVVPLASMLLLSLFHTILLNILSRLGK